MLGLMLAMRLQLLWLLLLVVLMRVLSSAVAAEKVHLQQNEPMNVTNNGST